GRELGRPALDGDTLLFHRTVAHGAEIHKLDLRTGTETTLRRQPRVLLLNPSALNGRMVYVRSTARTQQLRYGGAVPRGVVHDGVRVRQRLDRERAGADRGDPDAVRPGAGDVARGVADHHRALARPWRVARPGAGDRRQLGPRLVVGAEPALPGREVAPDA